MKKIYVSPGNAGIASVPKVTLVTLNLKDNKVIISFFIPANKTYKTYVISHLLSGSYELEQKGKCQLGCRWT